MRGTLLDDMQREANCYLSALREPNRLAATLRQMERLDLTGYGLEECNYSLSYLLGKPVTFSTMEELRAFLAKIAQGSP